MARIIEQQCLQLKPCSENFCASKSGWPCCLEKSRSMSSSRTTASVVGPFQRGETRQNLGFFRGWNPLVRHADGDRVIAIKARRNLPCHGG